MKLLRKTLPAIFTAGILAAGPVAAGPASAYTVADISLAAALHDVSVVVEGNVMTLEGTVEDNIDKMLLEKVAQEVEGIQAVQNHLRVSKTKLSTKQAIGGFRDHIAFNH